MLKWNYFKRDGKYLLTIMYPNGRQISTLGYCLVFAGISSVTRKIFSINGTTKFFDEK